MYERHAKRGRAVLTPALLLEQDSFPPCTQLPRSTAGLLTARLGARRQKQRTVAGTRRRLVQPAGLGRDAQQLWRRAAGGVKERGPLAGEAAAPRTRGLLVDNFLSTCPCRLPDTAAESALAAATTSDWFTACWHDIPMRRHESIRAPSHPLGVWKTLRELRPDHKP
jgi:hypothetical protein